MALILFGMRDVENYFEAYVNSLYPPEDAVLLQVRRNLQAIGREGINISANEARFLQILMHLTSVEKLVEIGTSLGYSTIWLARALSENGFLWTIEKDVLTAKMAREHFSLAGLNKKISLLNEPADTALQKLAEHAPFDMVFIDANKSAYPQYLSWAITHVRVGGLIVADNTLLFGHVLSDPKPDKVSKNQWQGMRDFNQQMAMHPQLKSVLLPTAEGLSVAIKVSAAP